MKDTSPVREAWKDLSKQAINRNLSQSHETSDTPNRWRESIYIQVKTDGQRMKIKDEEVGRNIIMQKRCIWWAYLSLPSYYY